MPPQARAMQLQEEMDLAPILATAKVRVARSLGCLLSCVRGRAFWFGRTIHWLALRPASTSPGGLLLFSGVPRAQSRRQEVDDLPDLRWVSHSLVCMCACYHRSVRSSPCCRVTLTASVLSILAELMRRVPTASLWTTSWYSALAGV